MSKPATLILIAVLVLSSIGAIAAVSAESIPKPSVPEFTVKYVDNSYDVPPTYDVDPYTGEPVMTYAGYHIENKSIEVIIKNQHFTSYRNENGSPVRLCYYVRYKGHFENWTTGYPDWEHMGEHYVMGYRSPSDSEYTVVDFGFAGNNGSDTYGDRLRDEISAGDKLDFRVEAIIGYSTLVNEPAQFYMVPYGDEISRHYDFTGERSGWSDTQTITIGEDQVPALSEQQLFFGVFAVVAVFVFGLVLFYLIKRK